MASSDSGEKTEDPTPKRRMDARRKGTVAKSTDLTGAIVLLAVGLAIPSAAGQLSSGLLLAFQRGMTIVPTEFSNASLMDSVWTIARPGMLAFLMIVGVAMVAGLGASFAQVGFVLSAESLQPSLAKLNPLEGFKRLLSFRSVFEGIKALAKGLLFGFVAFSVIAANWNLVASLGYLSAAESATIVGHIAHTILMRVALIWLVIGFIDYGFQRKQIEKQLKMTKDELRREMKEQEGSPELKGERMRRARKLTKGRMADKIRTADVIVTNPTHFSVAIKYNRSEMHAPMVVAKGQDYLALRIREMAKEHRIPIVPNPPLARALYKQCEVGDFVPRDQFAAVAEILAYVYKVLSATKKAS